MARYKSRGIRGKWTEDNMIKALAAVKRGVMKVYTASKHFNIPRRTLKRYLTDNKKEKSSLGRKPLLSKEQENDLEARIMRLCNVGYPLTPRVLRTSVKTFCNMNNIPVSSNSAMIGRDWLRGFLKRHKGLSQRKAQNLNPARAQKLNKIVVADYFEKLRKVLEDNNLLNSPERIFNIDEKGCQLNLHKAPQVLAQRGAKRVHLVGHEHAENVTVVSCGNALGQAIPPMILFKGKRMKPEWKDSLPNGTNVQMTPKGSMNIATFVEWIHHLAKYKLPGPCVVLFDGAKCHLDYSIVEAADKFDIKLFCLPSNTTHELQPMDKSVFRSFEYFWDEEVLKYWAHHEDRRITKHRFGLIFSKVWDKAMTPANIKAGFEATGIYPFDPTKIPEEAYAPSIPTQVSIPEESVNPATKDSSDSEDDIPLAAFVSVTNRDSTSSCSSGSIGKTQSPSVVADEDHLPIPSSSKCTATKNSILGRSDMSPEDKTVHDSAGYRETASSNKRITDTESSSSENITVSGQPLLLSKDRETQTASPSLLDNVLFDASTPLHAKDLTPVKVSDIAIEGSTPLSATYSTPVKDFNMSIEDSALLAAKYSTPVKDYRDIEASAPLITKSSTQNCNDKTVETLVPMPSTSSGSNISFKMMFKTPQKVSSPIVTRKKAINSLAQVLSKEIFDNKENRIKITNKQKVTDKNKSQDKNIDKEGLKKGKWNGKGKGKGKAIKERASNESWYCFVCQEDKIADMRLCKNCASYVHEECVGLTAKDKEEYICNRCED